MANFFQPGPSSTTATTTPSPAQQAEAKFRTEMLGRILDSLAGQSPTFANFVQGGPATRDFPGGFGPDIASLLGAMGQPGAFTSTATQKSQGATPSGISDLSQVALLGYLLSQATGMNLSSILSPLGGALGIGGVNPALGDTTPTPGFTSSLPSGDVPGVNFTPDPNAMSIDPNAGLPPDLTNLFSY